MGYSHCYKPILGTVHVNDVEWDQMKEASKRGQAEEYAVYLRIFARPTRMEY